MKHELTNLFDLMLCWAQERKNLEAPRPMEEEEEGEGEHIREEDLRAVPTLGVVTGMMAESWPVRRQGPAEVINPGLGRRSLLKL